MDYQYAILAATWYRSSGSQIYLHILAAKSASKQQHENYSIKNRRGSRSINDGSAISLQVFKDLCSEKCFGPCRWKVYRSWRGAEVIVQSETFPLCFFPFLSFSFFFSRFKKDHRYRDSFSLFCKNGILLFTAWNFRRCFKFETDLVFCYFIVILSWPILKVSFNGYVINFLDIYYLSYNKFLSNDIN